MISSMQAQTEKEMDLILKDISSFYGWQWSNLLFDEKVLQIQLSGPNDWLWMSFRLKGGKPYFFFSKERIFLIKDKKKPIQLFFKSHFKGLDLEKVERVEKLGRLIRFYFSADQETSMEISLIPGKVNVTLYKGDKQISAFKPKDIEPAPNDTFEDSQPREPQYFEDLWQRENKPQKNNAGDGSLKKDLKKKQKGLKKMEEKLEEVSENLWEKAGEWIKKQQSIAQVPEEFDAFIDSSKSLSWNIEHIFTQAKKNKGKLEGTKERIEILKKEISELEQGRGAKKKDGTPSLLKKAELKGKTYEIDGYRLFIGRSGPDNLKLLRKAKPWYLWLHIKDYPGAHGILERDKKSGEPKPQIVVEAAQKVIAQSLPKGAQGKFECLYAECRYVRPIKGAKSGQVTYSHEKVVGVRV
jgi:hypothetical protein